MRLIWAIVVSVPVWHAHAQDIPRYPVDRICRTVAVSKANGSPQIAEWATRQCIYQEQNAYDFIRRVWGRLTPQTRADCIRYGDEPKPMNYGRMANCILLDLPGQSQPFRY